MRDNVFNEDLTGKQRLFNIVFLYIIIAVIAFFLYETRKLIDEVKIKKSEANIEISTEIKEELLAPSDTKQ